MPLGAFFDPISCVFLLRSTIQVRKANIPYMKTNIALENKPSQKETYLPTSNFIAIFRCELLVLGSVELETTVSCLKRKSRHITVVSILGKISHFSKTCVHGFH